MGWRRRPDEKMPSWTKDMLLCQSDDIEMCGKRINIIFNALICNSSTRSICLYYKSSQWIFGLWKMYKRGSLDIVTHVPLDYMHLCCIGVMKRMLQIWQTETKFTRMKVECFRKNCRRKKKWPLITIVVCIYYYNCIWM